MIPTVFDIPLFFKAVISPTAPPTSPTPSGTPTSLPIVIVVPPVAKVMFLNPVRALSVCEAPEALNEKPALEDTVIPESVVVDRPKDIPPPCFESLSESAE